MTGIQFQPLFTMKVRTSPLIVGDVPAGYFRRAGIISDGTFEGERLSGRVHAGRGDWLFPRPDGVIHIDVRAMLETDRQEVIYMTYTGRLRQPDDAEARMAAGETIDNIYFRTAVQFETAAADLLWLNDIVAFGFGQRRPEGPVYDVYELL